MALDPRKRQQKIERRKAKERSRGEAERKQAQQAAGRLLESIATAPVLHSCHSASLWEVGIGHVILSRQLPHGKIAFADFLLDIHCLGVKDAIFDIVTATHYEWNFYDKIRSEITLVPLEPAAVRKLVEGGVAYAANLGFSPHPDYAKAKQVLEGIDVTACNREFEYGKNGKPFFIAGRHDGHEKSRRIVQMLHARCGAGGFDYIAPVEEASLAKLGIGPSF